MIREPDSFGGQREGDLLRRITPYPVPDAPINPLQAAPEVLRRYGLPPRPDLNAQPMLCRAWERVFGHELRLLPFTPDRLPIVPPVRLVPLRLDAQPVQITRFEGSNNWSGAYISANEGRQFLQIWGVWTIPDHLKKPPPPFQGDPGKPYNVASWIGLDGQRRYFDASLPQMGTTSVLEADGTHHAFAWVQWFAPTEVGIKIFPIPFSVHPGHTVGCVLTVIGPQKVLCVIVNLTMFTSQTITFTPPFCHLPGGGLAQPTVSGATAEWVVERSTDPDDPGRLDNFPDYGQTRFDLCLAVAGEQPDLPGLLAGVPTGLQGARDIRMFERLDHPARIQFISMPRKLDDTTLRLRYGGFR